MSDPASRLDRALEGRYRVERKLGEGGMAAVYLSRDLKHDRKVAVKVLSPDFAEAVGAQRFLREIRTAATLSHPNILPLFDSGEADGFLYYVMPYVGGESLREMLKRERQLPVEDAVRLAGEVADALSYAHGAGVIHRDVKPANILLEAGHAILADFGVAHALAEAKGERVTGTGIALGTPGYMSPEQAAGDPDLDERSDQYSLGCVLYEMLAGDPPFTGFSPLAVLARQLDEGPPSIAVVRPSLPRALAEATERALATIPADRFRTMAEFREAMTGGASARPERAPDRRAKRRGWLKWAVPAALALAGVASYLAVPPPQPLEDSRLLVFPLEVSGQPMPDETGRGEDNAYLIWNVLDGRGSLQWLNALRLVDHPEELARMSAQRRRALAAQYGAGFYLDGRLMLFQDSARAYLNLHKVIGDAVVARTDMAGPRSEAMVLGVRAVGKLLVALLPEETVDVSAVTGHNVKAIQTFVYAERQFYAGRFRRALSGYHKAVGQDSAFALAAVKGAQAASWLHRPEDATGLIRIALSRRASLTRKQLFFARGLQAFFEDRADSAVHCFREAIAVDSEWSEAWTGLGEVYTHLLPRSAPQDSLAEDAFNHVYKGTRHSAPALFHLAEFAVRRGNLNRASALVRQYETTDPDTTDYATRKLDLMLECAGGSPAAIDWRARVLRDPSAVLEAARSLGVGGAYPNCALQGFRAILAYDTSDDGKSATAYWASVGLQSMLAATGRVVELVPLLDTIPQIRPYYLLDALAGVPVEVQAEAEADSLQRWIGSLSAWETWYLAVWDAHRHHLDEARALLDATTEQSARTPDRTTRLIAASLRAHVAFAEGDTVRAIHLLDSLSPDAQSRALLAYPWESLGLERLLLARLRLAEGRYLDAYREAAVFDSPGAANLIFSLFLPASLELRLEAVRALGDQRAVDSLRSRLDALRR